MRKLFSVMAVVLSVALLSACGIRRKKYETPIVSDSKQPDKTLFEKAVGDIEHSRYEVARLTLQTLINTYPDSEYLAKAKLAIADAWYRQGGTSSLAQAEAEYKDFITFFPTMAEASEAQLKVAMIHYQQMEKADRDSTHARRAEDEFKQLLLQFPNSPFTEEAKQRLREVQEVIAEHEYRVGRLYYVKGNPRAAIPRLKDLTDNYPNYSQADQALWMIGQSFEKGGKEFRTQAANAYSKILSDYPLSDLADGAKQKLEEWKMPVPQAKPEAYARMKYDLEHREQPGWRSRAWGLLSKKPDVSSASKAGEPVLTSTEKPAEEPAAVNADANPTPGTVGIQLQPVKPSEDTAVSTKPASDTSSAPPQTNPPATPAGTTPAAAPPAPATATASDKKQPEDTKDQKKKGKDKKKKKPPPDSDK